MDSLIQELNKTRRGSQKPALDLDDTQALNKNIASVANLTSAANASIMDINIDDGEVSSHSLNSTITHEPGVEDINPVNLETEPISVSLAQPNFKPFIKKAVLAMLVFLFFLSGDIPNGIRDHQQDDRLL